MLPRRTRRSSLSQATTEDLPIPPSQPWAASLSRSRSESSYSTTDDVSLFFIACRDNDVVSVQRALHTDPALATVLRNGFSALHVAAKYNAVGCVSAILQADPVADRMVDAVAGLTAFARACERGRLDTARVLLEHRKEGVKDLDLAHYSPLHRAAASGNAALCRLLLEHGAEVDYQDPKTKESPLFHAVRVGAVDAARVLIENGAKLDLVNYSYSTCLFLAVRLDGHDNDNPNFHHHYRIRTNDNNNNSNNSYKDGGESMINLLLKSGCNPNVRDDYNTTPLSFAVDRNAFGAITSLLKHGADPEFAPHHDMNTLEKILRSPHTTKELINAFEVGLGKERVVEKLCELSGLCDSDYIVGKHVIVVGKGRGFCVEMVRPILNILGDAFHIIRFDETGVEEKLLLKRQGLSNHQKPHPIPFYLTKDANFPAPLHFEGKDFNEGGGIFTGISNFFNGIFGIS